VRSVWPEHGIRRALLDFLIRRGSRAVIAWRWPWPRRKPFERSALQLYSIGGGLGDELMCTPIFREIRRRNPGCRITFFSRFPEIFRSNPHLDVVRPFSAEVARKADPLWYVPKPPRPLITLMAECVGLEFSADRVEPPQIEPSATVRNNVEAIPRPRIVIQPQASRWTPNKQWPVESWTALIGQLTQRFEVIEVGTDTLFAGQEFGERFHTFAGATSLIDLAWVISQADVFVGPPSSGMHLANAFEIPTVAIFGGFEDPRGYDYPWAASLFSPVECAPCWLETPCPFDRKCLRLIQPEQVLQAIEKAIAAARPVNS